MCVCSIAIENSLKVDTSEKRCILQVNFSAMCICDCISKKDEKFQNWFSSINALQGAQPPDLNLLFWKTLFHPQSK